MTSVSLALGRLAGESGASLMSGLRTKTAEPTGGAQAPKRLSPAFAEMTTEAPGPAAGAIVSCGMTLIVRPLSFSTETSMCIAFTAEAQTVPGALHALAV